MFSNPAAASFALYSFSSSAPATQPTHRSTLRRISGGISPDLRKMDPAKEGDEWYIYRSLNGSAKDGRVLMPKFDGIVSQEGLWAIRSWLDTLPPPDDN